MLDHALMLSNLGLRTVVRFANQRGRTLQSQRRCLKRENATTQDAKPRSFHLHSLPQPSTMTLYMKVSS